MKIPTARLACFLALLGCTLLGLAQGQMVGQADAAAGSTAGIHPSAQPFTGAPAAGTFQPDIGEPAQRKQDMYKGFLFDFNGAGIMGVENTPNGKIQVNQVGNNPFLSTLPGDGNGQTLVTLGPCASNTPHTHPRGSEISYLLYGKIKFGMVEENGGGQELIIVDMKANQTVHVPTGILHFSYNNECKPAAFLANFATKDPGTQTMWNSLMKVPTYVLQAATGLPVSDIRTLKKAQLVKSPGTGGDECLKRCGLTFTTANAFDPSPLATGY